MSKGKYKEKGISIKKMFIAVCAAAVITGAMSITANAGTDIYASTTASYLHIRSGAGTSYSSVGVLPRNTSVTVIDRSNSGWLKVKLSNGTVGYCCAEYLDITTDGSTTTYLNLRSSPNTYSSVKKVLSPNTKLDIIKFSGNSWAYVRLYDGTTGYVCTDYVSYSNSSVSVQNIQTDSKVTISETSKNAKPNSSFRLTAQSSAGNVITWSSSDKSIAYVTSLGYVNTLKAGTVNITATDIVTGSTAVCTVNVTNPLVNSIKLDTTSKTVLIGETFKLNAAVSPANEKVIWKSSNSSVASVSSIGEVKALSTGTANITCTDSTGIVSAQCKVTVTSPENITLDRSSVTITAGTSTKLNVSKANSSTVIKWSSSDLSVASVTDGVVSGLKSGSATITASDSTGKIKATCRVIVNSQTNNGSVTLSHYARTTTAGKTVYIKGYSSRSASWGSSDENVADVYEGFIRTKNPGKAAITYTDTYGNRAICVVTVNESEPVKFAYSSPNSAALDSNVTLIAITDKTRTNVKFEVNVGGKIVTVNASGYTSDGDTYVWKGNYKPTQAGTFDVKAYAYKSGVWKTCDDGKTDIYIANKSSSSETSLSKLRPSDEIIRFIGSKEGFVSYVTYDVIANNAPTLAYGYVVHTGETFYNGLTKNEGYALLIDKVNNGDYSSRVNEMLLANNVRFNQQQFDALVSFSYNLGTGWTYGSDLKNIILNSYGTVSSGSTVTGTVIAPSGLNLRQSPTTGSAVKAVLANGERVTLVSTTKYNSVWYQVKTSSGITGYCSGTYLNLSTSGTVGRDLNYVNRNALIREMLSYHHSGGVCYYGLLYRRADELEMFLYGDYKDDGRSNKYGFPNPSCISW